MDATAVLTELAHLSTEIEHAAILDAEGEVVAATPGAPAGRLARAAAELMRIADSAQREAAVDRVEVALPTGGVIAVRNDERTAIAITTPEPPAALVVHDLRFCLDRISSSGPSSPGPRRGRGKRSNGA